MVNRPVTPVVYQKRCALVRRVRSDTPGLAKGSQVPQISDVSH